jgi:hypothetical protein
MEDFIDSFDQLSFHIEGMSNAIFQEFFIICLKDDICSHVIMDWP